MQRLFFVFVMCLAFRGAVEGQQFKEWSFQAPPGWQVTQHGDTAVLAPTDATPGSVYVQLFSGQKMDGNLQSWLEERAQQDTQSLQVAQSTPAAIFQRSGAMQKMLVLKKSANELTVRMYIGMTSSSGIGELLFFNADAAVAKRYTAVFSNFVNTIQFSGSAGSNAGTQTTPPVAQPQVPQRQNEPAATGAVVAGHVVNGGAALDGWYAESIIRVYGMSQSTVWNFYRFFPDGWVYRSMPQQGDLSNIACPQAGTGREQCQRYSIQGRMIRIGSDKPESFEVVPGPDGELRFGGGPVWPVRPLPGTPMGTYEAVGGGSMLGSASLRISEMTFMPGGRFTNSRSTGVGSNTANTSASAYRSGGGSGQYRINGYDLQLQFGDGSQSTTRIVAPTQDMDMLVIGGTVYIRKGAR